MAVATFVMPVPVPVPVFIMPVTVLTVWTMYVPMIMAFGMAMIMAVRRSNGSSRSRILGGLRGRAPRFGCTDHQDEKLAVLQTHFTYRE